MTATAPVRLAPSVAPSTCAHCGNSVRGGGAFCCEGCRAVRDGFLPKQMPAWGKPLGEARVRAVTAYVMSIQGTHAAGGKAPQGVKSP